MTGLELSKASEIVLKFKDQVSRLLNLATDEVKQFFDNGVENYLDVQYQKYAFTKTFLHRDEPVDFYQIFYPVTISSSKRKINTEDISDFLEEDKFSAIVGAAGSGKTMLIKHIFLISFRSIFKIPVVIELRSLNSFSGTFSEFLFQNILGNKLAVNDHIMKRLLENGKFIFLLDGYDEIYSDKKQKITDEIDKFIDTYNQNNYVISSRPGASVETLPRFTSYNVQPLNINDINKFIDHQLTYYKDKELIQKIKELIQLPQNSSFISFIQNPLLLSMFILTYSDHPELPKLKSTFYYNVYDTLSTKHDTITKKGGYQHERKSGLSKEQILTFLKFFSLQSLFDGFFSFNDHYFNILCEKIKSNRKLTCDNENLLYDLLVSINIFIRDGTILTYPHKSIQEYLAAACIAEQSIEFKKKVYEEKINKYFLRSVGGLTNFWEMLSELDKECLFKYFALPNSKRLLSDIGFSETADPIQVTLNLFQLLNYTHTLTKIANGEFINNSASSRSITNLVVSLLLINRTTIHIMYNTSDLSRKRNILENFIERGLLRPTFVNNVITYDISYSSLRPEESVKLLNNTDIVSNTFKILKTINMRIHSTEKEIRDELDSKISFLD